MHSLLIIDIVEEIDGDNNNIIVVIGKDEHGQEKHIRVSSTPHSIYIPVPDTYTNTGALHTDLNAELIRKGLQCRTWMCECGGDSYGIYREPCVKLRRSFIQAVTNVSIVKNLRGFEGYEANTRSFAKITLSNSALFGKAAKILESDFQFPEIRAEHRGVYGKSSNGVESFQHELSVSGFEWIQYPDTYDNSKKTLDIPFHELSILTYEQNIEKPLVKIVPFYFDIETIGKTYEDKKSSAAEYPVGVISCYSSPTVRKTFILKKAPGDLTDASPQQPYWQYYDTEIELLDAFHTFFLSVNPDIVSGYYSNAFDMPYLLKRAEKLGMDHFAYMSRLPFEPIYMRKTSTFTNQQGLVEVTIIDCPGRIFYDFCPVARDTMKLDSYKLAAVAKKLGLQGKDDLKYDEIYDHFHGTKDQRDKLVSYCDQDVKICVDFEKCRDIYRFLIFLCRVLRILPKDALNRKVSYHLYCAVRHECKGRYLLMARSALDPNGLHPAFANIYGYKEMFMKVTVDKEKYKGAKVFDPITGIYMCPVLTFDFTSLYPSIIRTFNICRSTQLPCVLPVDHPNYVPCHVSPINSAYVTQDVREGVFPALLRRLMDSRAKIKADMVHVKDPERIGAMKAEESAIKLVSNSLYGQMGALTGMLTLLTGAQSVTAYGSKFIREMHHQLNTSPRFKKYGLQVIYGDTDSLFCALHKLDSLDGIDEIGKEIRNWINKECGVLQGCLAMGFEDAAIRFMLLSKKHYVKLLYVNGLPQLKIAGLENRSMTKYTIQCQKEVFRMAFVCSCTPEQIAEQVKQWFADLYMNRVDIKLLSHSRKLTKELNDYEDNQPHAQVARQLKYSKFKVSVGDRLSYYYCNILSKEDNQRVVAAELMDGHTLDLERYALEMEQTFKNTVVHLLRGRTEAEKLTRLHELAHDNKRVVTRPVKMQKMFDEAELDPFVEKQDDHTITTTTTTTTTTTVTEPPQKKFRAFELQGWNQTRLDSFGFNAVNHEEEEEDKDEKEVEGKKVEEKEEERDEDIHKLRYIPIRSKSKKKNDDEENDLRKQNDDNVKRWQEYGVVWNGKVKQAPLKKPTKKRTKRTSTVEECFGKFVKKSNH